MPTQPLEPPAFHDSQRGGPPVFAWLAWRINRLRCMSLGEVGHRLRRRLRSEAELFGLIGATAVPLADLGQPSQHWIAVPTEIASAPYLAAADRLRAGHFDVFALHGIELGSPPNWNRDPKSGVVAPLSFGKLLDYRDPQQVGDIKYLWEVNRHLHLVTLAQAWALSGDKKYFKTIELHLLSWFDACPEGDGANWSSALEAGLRLINWSLTWQLLGGMTSPLFAEPAAAAFRRRWLDAIHQHARFIAGFFSLHSSANNHLIGEAAGLFVAAVTWPCWPQAEAWRQTAQTILEREILLQNAPDGVNREQATAYQQFEIDLLLLPWLAGRANGVEFSPAYPAMLEKMLAFLAAIMDAGGHVPMFGDADDGVALKLTPSDSQAARYRSSLATGAILFARPDLASKAGVLDDKSRWLLGEDAPRLFAVQAEAAAGLGQLPMRQVFPHGGYYILGCAFASEAEIRLVADAGPLGYQRIAAHGHADALSFTLSVGGREFLIDPGTYAYHTQGAWRQYFRGTSAHNTVRIDGADQSLSGGNFMWLRQASAHCSHWHSSATEDVFEGYHDGYRHLPDPVTHQRRISLDKIARRITIEDRFEMQGEHEMELFFHCAERCQVAACADGYTISLGEQHLTLRLPDSNPNRHALYRASTTPILGWVSRRFDDKQASATIKWSARLRGSTVLVSQIDC